MREAIIVDIDGTLADNKLGKRGIFDWHLVSGDQPHLDIIELVTLYKYAGYAILVVSGRDEICRGDTEDWLEIHDVPCDELFMRPLDDNRKDTVIKEEIYRAKIEGDYSIRVVLDDRQQVVDMWRSLGLRVLQVAPGDF
jgi:phosphoglycolate phosphatase-like HAD superfamily hydrolase